MVEKVLVTGATGFIASRCILELLASGYDVKGTVRDLDRASRFSQVLRGHSNKADDIEAV